MIPSQTDVWASSTEDRPPGSARNTTIISVETKCHGAIQSSLFHVVGRLVAVDRNLGGGWLPRGRPHRTEHLELTAPLGGLTADRPPRTICRSPPIMSLPVLSPSVGALSLEVSVFLQRKSPPLSDRATWFSETTERAMMHAASLTGQQGRGKGGTNKFQAGSLLRPNPSRRSRTSLSLSSRLLLFGAPPFSSPGSRQPASPIVWGAPTVGGDGQVFYIRSHNFIKPSGMESISSPHRTSAKPMANEHQDPSSYSLCFGGEHSGRTARRGFCCRR